MKSILILTAALALSGNFSVAQQLAAPAAKTTSGPTVDVITNEELLARRKSEKFKGFAQTETSKQTHDIQANSEFINFGKDTTLVPKGAILFTPERYRQNVISGISGNFVVWNEFITKNRGLVTQFEVTIEQASGKKAIEESRMEAAKRSGLIIVAVLNRNPISVVPVTTNP